MRSLPLKHHIYTSSRKKRGYYTIYISNSLEPLKEELEQRGFYRRPRGKNNDDFAARPTTKEELDKFPVRLQFYYLEDGRPAICHSVYKGRDNHSRSPRFGNYYSHTAVVDQQRASVNPLLLYQNIDWQDEKLEDGLNELQGQVVLTEDQVSLLGEFLTERKGAPGLFLQKKFFDDDRRLAMLVRIIDRLIEQPNQRFLILDAAPMLHWWMLAVHLVFPENLDKQLTFDSYAVEPDKSEVQLMGYPENADRSEQVTPADVQVIDIAQAGAILPRSNYAQAVCNALQHYADSPEEAKKNLSEVFNHVVNAGATVIGPRLNDALEFHGKLQQIKQKTLEGKTLQQFVRDLGNDMPLVERVLQVIREYVPDELVYFLEKDMSIEPRKIRSFQDLWNETEFDPDFRKKYFDQLLEYLLKHAYTGQKIEIARQGLRKSLQSPDLLEDEMHSLLGNTVFKELQKQNRGQAFFSDEIKEDIQLLNVVGYNNAAFVSYKADYELIFNLQQTFGKVGRAEEKRRDLYQSLQRAVESRSSQLLLEAIYFALQTNNAEDFNWSKADKNEIEQFDTFFKDYGNIDQIIQLKKSLKFSGEFLRLSHIVKKGDFAIEKIYKELSRLEPEHKNQIVNQLDFEQKKQFWQLELMYKPQDGEILKAAIEDKATQTDEDALEYLQSFLSNYSKGNNRQSTAANWAFKLLTNDSSSFLVVHAKCAKLIAEQAASLYQHPNFQNHETLVKWIRFYEAKHNFKIPGLPEKVEPKSVFKTLNSKRDNTKFQDIEVLLENKKYEKDFQSLLHKIEENFFKNPFTHEDWMIFFDMLQAKKYPLEGAINDTVAFIRREYKLLTNRDQPVHAWLLGQLIIAVILTEDQKLLIKIAKEHADFGENFFMTGSTKSRFKDRDIVQYIITSVKGLSKGKHLTEAFENVIEKSGIYGRGQTQKR